MEELICHHNRDILRAELLTQMLHVYQPENLLNV